MRRTVSLSSVIAVLFCCTAAMAAPTPAWIEESNRNAAVLLDVIARFAPESAGQLGVEGYDEAVIDLGPNVYERGQAAMRTAVEELRRRRETAASRIIYFGLIAGGSSRFPPRHRKLRDNAK